MAKRTIDDTLDFVPETLSADGKTYRLWVPVDVDKSLVDSGIVNKVANMCDGSWEPTIPDLTKYPGVNPHMLLNVPLANMIPNPQTSAYTVALSFWKSLAQKVKFVIQQATIQAAISSNADAVPSSVAPFLPK